MSEGTVDKLIALGRLHFARLQDRRLAAFLHIASAEGRKHHARDCWCGQHAPEGSE